VGEQPNRKTPVVRAGSHEKERKTMKIRKSDFRQEVTDEVIRLIEAGTAPWIVPWQTGEIAAAFNPTTNIPYRGGNIIALMCASLRKGYRDPRWMTYRQAVEKGWQVRKGEKASRIEFFKDELLESDATGDKKRRVIVRHYPVFNAQQIDGVPKLDLPKKENWEAIKAGEKIMKKSGAVIKYGGDRAYYHTVRDYIQLPKREDFHNAAMFYSTACHELAHWTGHTSRLNRATCMQDRNSEDYAREELVAELASLFVSAETGLPFDPMHHAAYIKSWLRVLKTDKNEIFRAASSASKATDYLLQKKAAKAKMLIGGSRELARAAA
jgi:antirestriction protein ArdC